MKIALIGYGKMGQMIDRLAPHHDVEVVSRMESEDTEQGIEAASLHGADVAIEFTAPHSAVENVNRLASLGVHIVVGTTGWLQRLPEVEAAVQAADIGLVWSPNFSMGMHAFMRVVREGARALGKMEEYEAWAYEIHHSAKLDAPSGTLIKLVEEMTDSGWDRNVSIASNRAGSITGTHEIGWDSPYDTITLRHTARTREGFAHGALRAAKWIKDKKGVHEFSDIVFD